MEIKGKLLKALKNFDAIITGTTLTLCVLIVNANVVMRYIAKSPIKWSEEVVTSLFVWTVFLGSAYAHRKHAHLGVDIITNRLRGKTKVIVDWSITIIELVILVMITIISSTYVYHLLYVGDKFKPSLTEYLRIPRIWTGIAVPIGFGLSTIYSVIFILRDKLHIIKGKPPAEPEDGGESHQVEGGNY